MLKRPHFIALGLVGLLALVLLNLPHQASDRLKLAIGSLFLPLFGLSKSGQQLARQGADAVAPRSDLIKENAALLRTNQLLKMDEAQLEILQRENNNLRQLLQWQQRSPWGPKLRLANVIARDPANWWQIIHLDLGSRDGVRADLPVLSPTGELVGRVSAVSLTRSDVMLLGNAECRVSVIVEKSGQTGILVGGASPVDHTLVTLSFLSGSGNLKPGQAVLTTGLAVLPPGVRVGQLAEEPYMTGQGYAEATVKLWADPGALSEVWVLLP